ncbi:hypothetical protein [Microlunatus sp. GCM10028923]|uniref:hypothetical protein n=1 Tax=Microlunatus sp. GCM10028923 TaxID=3273400 RepID=UPI003616BCC8
MTSRDPLDDLRDLAQLGERAARPSPPEEIRARGERRGRTRRIVAVAGTLAVAILAGVVGGGIVNQANLVPVEPVGGGTTPPPITAAPPIPFSDSLLPTESDLEWRKPGDWKLGETRHETRSGEQGYGVVSECLQDQLEAFGAEHLRHRTFLMGEDTASATALEFRDAEDARRTYAKLVDWGDACEKTLTDAGHERVKVYDWVEVPVDQGEAQYRLLQADQLEDSSGSQTMSSEYGVILTGSRVELLVMTLRAGGGEHHWAQSEEEAKSTGLPLDPMIRSLPKAAARLAGEPIRETPAPTPSRSLTDKNLLRASDLPKYEGLEPQEYKRSARPSTRPSTCLQSLETLGAVDFKTRSFNYKITDPQSSPDTSDPLYGQPTRYASALQFENEEQAKEAYETVSGWIENCADALDADGFRAPGGGPVRGFDQWYPVRDKVKTARFTEFVYQRPDWGDGEGAFWEAVGLVRVGDRLAIAVTVGFGMDSNWDTDPEENVAGPHPLADILPAAAKRLAD